VGVAASLRTKEHRAERRMNFRGSVVAHVGGPAARFIKTRRLPRQNAVFLPGTSGDDKGADQCSARDPEQLINVIQPRGHCVGAAPALSAVAWCVIMASFREGRLAQRAIGPSRVRHVQR
jgi:hypothetical protein